MAIDAGAAIWTYGTQDKLSDASTSSVANGVFSVAADVDSAWANDDEAVSGSYVLEATFASAPTVGTAVSLYARLMNIEGVNDMPVIDANFSGLYIGAFLLDAVTSVQYMALPDAPIPSVGPSQVIEYYIKNGGGQTLSAGWDLWVTPKAFIPHA